MSELRIPAEAYDSFANVEAFAPRIVAAELRRLVDELDAVATEMREEDGRGLRAAGFGAAIHRLRTRADELDPEGSQR